MDTEPITDLVTDASAPQRFALVRLHDDGTEFDEPMQVVEGRYENGKLVATFTPTVVGRFTLKRL